METIAIKYVGIRDDLVHKKVQDDLVVLSLTDGTYYRLNPTAADLWLRIKDSGDPERAIDEMKKEYDVPDSRIDSELREMVAQWLQEGLICISEPVPDAGSVE